MCSLDARVQQQLVSTVNDVLECTYRSDHTMRRPFTIASHISQQSCLAQQSWQQAWQLWHGEDGRRQLKGAFTAEAPRRQQLACSIYLHIVPYDSCATCLYIRVIEHDLLKLPVAWLKAVDVHCCLSRATQIISYQAQSVAVAEQSIAA